MHKQAIPEILFEGLVDPEKVDKLLRGLVERVQSNLSSGSYSE